MLCTQDQAGIPSQIKVAVSTCVPVSISKILLDLELLLLDIVQRSYHRSCWNG